jgi:hypothetical protein
MEKCRSGIKVWEKIWFVFFDRGPIGGKSMKPESNLQLKVRVLGWALISHLTLSRHL